MNQATYRQAIERTWNDAPPEQYQPANAALGVVGEVREYADQRDADELGDLLYYLATLRRLLDLEVLDHDDAVPFHDSEAIHRLHRRAGRVAELTKKFVFHDADTREGIHRCTDEMLSHVASDAAELADGGLAEIRRRNVDKLRDRYPEGFDPDRAP